MCLTPVMIDNPYYRSRSPTVRMVKDTDSTKIAVPCGHCSACLQLRQAYFVQRVQCECIDHDMWSCMLSYNNKYLPTIEVNGYKHKYADIRDIQLLIQRLKKRDDFPKFRYFAISEFGGERHRPHWHLLFFTPKIPGESQASIYTREQSYWSIVLSEWYCNLGSKRVPIKDPLLTYHCNSRGKRNYDFRYVDPKLNEDSQADTSFYTSKYLTKSSDYVQRLRTALFLNLDQADFRFYWNIIRPKSGRTIGFGDINNPKVLDYLHDCVQYALRHQFPFPVFINPNTGQTFPMSPYLYKKIQSPEYDIEFRRNRDHLCIQDSNVAFTVPLTQDEIKLKSERFKRIQEKIDKRDIGDYLDTQTSVNNDLYGNFDENLKLFEIASDHWKNYQFDCDPSLFDSDGFL